MHPPGDLVHWLVLTGCLLGTFVGAGLYLRGFWLYFRVVAWLRDPGRAALRRRYRSSAMTAIFKDPQLAEIKAGLLWGLAGLPLFAVAGIVFNAMLH